MVGLVALPWAWLLLRRWLPGADFVDLVMPWLGVMGAAFGGLAVLFSPRLRVLGVVAVSGAMVAAVVTLAPRWPSTPTRVAGGGLRVMTQNMTGERGDVSELSVAIDDERPDVLVVTESTASVRAGLVDRFPHVASVAPTDRGPQPYLVPEVDVFSRYPLEVSGGPAWLPGVRAVVAAPTGPVVVYGLHLAKVRVATDHEYSLPRPVRAQLVDDVVAALRAETLPTVVAGDLNLWDRSSEYRHLLRVMRDATRVTVPRSTTRRGELRWLFIRGDHVLMSRSWCATRYRWFEVRGADHRGIVVTVGACQN